MFENYKILFIDGIFVCIFSLQLFVYKKFKIWYSIQSTMLQKFSKCEVKAKNWISIRLWKKNTSATQILRETNFCKFQIAWFAIFVNFKGPEFWSWWIFVFFDVWNLLKFNFQLKTNARAHLQSQTQYFRFDLSDKKLNTQLKTMQ